MAMSSFPSRINFPNISSWGKKVQIYVNVSYISYRSANAWTTKRAPDSPSWSQRQLWKPPGREWKMNCPALQSSTTFSIQHSSNPNKTKTLVTFFFNCIDGKLMSLKEVKKILQITLGSSTQTFNLIVPLKSSSL